jgi:hypothetical protein
VPVAARVHRRAQNRFWAGGRRTRRAPRRSPSGAGRSRRPKRGSSPAVLLAVRHHHSPNVGPLRASRRRLGARRATLRPSHRCRYLLAALGWRRREFVKNARLAAWRGRRPAIMASNSRAEMLSAALAGQAARRGPSPPSSSANQTGPSRGRRRRSPLCGPRGDSIGGARLLGAWRRVTPPAPGRPQLDGHVCKRAKRGIRQDAKSA